MVVGSSPTGPTNSPSDLLKLVEADAAPAVELKHSRMILQVRPGTNNGKKQAILAGWYREQIKQAAPPRIAKWERLLRVRVSLMDRIMPNWQLRRGQLNQLPVPHDEWTY